VFGYVAVSSGMLRRGQLGLGGRGLLRYVASASVMVCRSGRGVICCDELS